MFKNIKINNSFVQKLLEYNKNYIESQMFFLNNTLLLAENKISENTIVYNTSVSDQKEFNNWEQELKNTWLSKYHVKV